MSTSDKNSHEEIEEFDAIVIGAGVTGLYSLYRMRQLGFGPSPSITQPEPGLCSSLSWFRSTFPC
jgi:hypothetical protein